MTSQTRELFREMITSLVAESGAMGARVPGLTLTLRSAGFDEAAKHIEPEIQYLADKGLISAVDKTLSPENKRWRITATGRDFLAEKGLA